MATGLPGRLIKKHKGNMKKAWAEFRGGAKKGAAKRVSKRKSVKRKSPRRKSKGVPVMAKKRTRRASSRRRKTSVSRVRRYAARAKGAAKAVLSSRPVELATGVAVATGGAVATSLAINNIPFVKNLNPLAKSGTQIALGIGAVLLRRKLLAQLGAGAVMAGTMGLVRGLVGVEPLAGTGSRRLTQSELQSVMGRLGRPVDYQGAASLGRPVNYVGADSLGRPASPEYHTGWSGGFGSGF